MDASSLTRDLDTLERSWSSLDQGLNCWTILVVVGVAMELAVIIAEYIHGWRDFKRGTIVPPEKPSLSVFALSLLGAALVAAGVAGEFGIHVKAGKVESDIRSKSRELVGIFQREASTAQEKAGEANTIAEGLRLKVSQANERAADAALQTEKIRERLSGRSISPKQHQEFVKALLPYRGVRVRLTKLVDKEAGEFADAIISVLTEAGWNIDLNTVGILPSAYGLTCTVDNQALAAKPLVKMLRMLPGSKITTSPTKGAVADILVGLRLPP